MAREAMLASARWITQNQSVILDPELSVDDHNGRTISLDRRCGFLPSGAMHIGQLGQEIIMTAPVAKLVSKGPTP